MKEIATASAAERSIELTHATPDASTEGLGQFALLLQQLGLDLVEWNATHAEVMQSRISFGIEFFEEGVLENRIRGVHVPEDVIARGTEKDTDRDNTAGCGHLQKALDETHCDQVLGWRK